MQAISKPKQPFKKGSKSHFQFKNWAWDDAGVRKGALPVRPVRPIRREAADLVNTCYANPAKGTKTLFALVWDLDAHRADQKWLDKDGALVWSRLKKTLKLSHPEIFTAISHVVRSTSCKGLAVVLPISPMELHVPSTEKAQNSARALQVKILKLFNHYGFGADPGALGLERDFPNFHDKTRLVEENQDLLPLIQSAICRLSVVSRLLTYCNGLKELAYKKKKDDLSLLYPDSRVERGLAELYVGIYEGEYSHCLTTKEIVKITGLSERFIRELFADAHPRFLKEAEWLNKVEGWKLHLNFESDLLCRAYEVLKNKPSSRASQSPFKGGDLCPPEEVEDGERNEWLTRLGLLMKHNGIPESEALRLITDLIERIPGSAESRNCQYLPTILRSLYRNHVHLFGVKVDGLPSWVYGPEKKPSEAAVFCLNSMEPLPEKCATSPENEISEILSLEIAASEVVIAVALLETTSETSQYQNYVGYFERKGLHDKADLAYRLLFSKVSMEQHSRNVRRVWVMMGESPKKKI